MNPSVQPKEELTADVSPNGTVALECKVIGVPTPKLVWYKDEKELRSGDSYELRAENNTPTTTYKVVQQILDEVFFWWRGSFRSCAFEIGT